MPDPDLIDLMGLYARRGIDDWKNAPGELRRRANRCLGAPIADHEAEARITIGTTFGTGNDHRLKFIPMPKHPAGGIERCFFLPIRQRFGARERVAFDLFLLVGSTNCLAFRFDPAHVATSAHGYGHVQLSRKLLRKTIDPSGIPTWLPDRYPAFPVPSSEPLKMFLSMATAVHGYSGGIEHVLQDIFQRANRAREAGIYVSELRAMLN